MVAVIDMPSMHSTCIDLAMKMSGPHRALLSRVCAETSPAAAWVRTCAKERRDITQADAECALAAFGRLSDALAAVGLTVSETGAYATLWRSGGVGPAGDC